MASNLFIRGCKCTSSLFLIALSRVASEPYTINDKQEGKGGIVALAPCYCPAEIYSSHAFTSSKNQ